MFFICNLSYRKRASLGKISPENHYFKEIFAYWVYLPDSFINKILNKCFHRLLFVILKDHWTNEI